VDFLLSEHRDVAAAKRFFRKGIRRNGTPRVITLDAYAASHRAVRELKSEGHLPRRVRLRSCKYLNNIVEQDHRRVKQQVRAMLGFQRFDTATITIRGIELAEKIKNSQFKTGKLATRSATAPEIGGGSRFSTIVPKLTISGLSGIRNLHQNRFSEHDFDFVRRHFNWLDRR
jgi:transposase-like protein